MGESSPPWGGTPRAAATIPRIGLFSGHHKMSLTDLSTPPRTSRVRVGLEKAALKSAIGAALAMGVLGAGQAQALVVTVGGQQWDVTTFTGSYSANTTKFNTAASGGQMPWWGSSTTANAFATAVGAGLGTPNIGTVGPLFGFRPLQGNVIGRLFDPVGGTVGGGGSTIRHEHIRPSDSCPSCPRPPSCPWGRCRLRLQPHAEEAD